MQAAVLTQIKHKTLDQTFTYQIPNGLIDQVAIGKRVLVPFGKQILEGFVISLMEDQLFDYELKEIVNVIDEEPVLNHEMLEIGRYMSKKTLASLTSCYQTMLPKALKAKHGTVIPKKYVSYLSINDPLPTISFTVKQQQLIDQIKEHGKILKRDVPSVSIMKTLLEKGVLVEKKQESYRLSRSKDTKSESVLLTDEQQATINQVLACKDRFQPFLLHGVTGSGKTEVYMHLIDQVLKRKKEAIVLVPEISLTPQMVRLFESRFKDQVAILHSGLSDGEKYDEWRKIERKEVSIVIGARSAIFAPFTNLGLIIIDEEHSTTYKQDSQPKYHTLDIALYRCRNYHCPLILGSATPSLESYTRAKLGIYQLLTMKNRIHNQLPKVTLVDMKEEIKRGNRIFSNSLIKSMEETFECNKQVILLLNRRGYTTVMTCQDCGNTVECPNCDIALTYHKSSNTMRCHYCGYGIGKPKYCSVCQGERFSDFGLGTQKLEELVREQFLLAKPIRMDLDTTSKKGAHEAIIEAFRHKEYNVLIGTQMISKGLDFEDVVVVGVLNGDATLQIPDFRSAERTFQLLSQVAGRAGRGKVPGQVIIQGFNIDHYSMKRAVFHDYEGFFQEEMNIRKTLSYPPYENISLIKISGLDAEKVLTESKKIASYLSNHCDKNTTVLGPSSALMPKLNKTYYMQLLLKYKHTNTVLKLLIDLIDQYKTNSHIKLEVDLSPVKM